ncbi:deoxyribodipyrimidine photo-lyase, partial [SAR202 cluster bacterium JH702]|nr:deoxyribodipyrimidine photo-lyase [SAR202 cluster bacterium JH702]
MSRYPISIWWVRSDLRLEDNPALSEATIESEVVIPVFVFDLKSEMPKSKSRSNFLNGALNDLDSRLREIGSRLLIKQGDTAQELAKIIDGES